MLASITVFGVSLPILVVAYMTLLQRRTPQRLMARVSVAAEVVMSVPSAASLALGALLVTVVDWRLIFAVIGVVTLAGAGHVAFWLRDVLRDPSAPPRRRRHPLTRLPGTPARSTPRRIRGSTCAPAT